MKEPSGLANMRGSELPLSERIATALHDFTHARASMHIPVEATDVDIVLSDCKSRIAELESQVEALSRTLRTVKELIRPPHTYVQDIDLINASKEIEKALREQS